jgi:hypothetical protein
MNRAPVFVLGCAAIVAMAWAGAGRAVAGDSGGIAGYVVSSLTGRPVAGEPLLYYRWPYVENATEVRELRTDAHGFFSDITLAPGRYVLVASERGSISGCTIDDVFGGEVSRVRVTLERNGKNCAGPRVNPALIDSAATSDLYRI